MDVYDFEVAGNELLSLMKKEEEKGWEGIYTGVAELSETGRAIRK